MTTGSERGSNESVRNLSVEKIETPINAAENEAVIFATQDEAAQLIAAVDKIAPIIVADDESATIIATEDEATPIITAEDEESASIVATEDEAAPITAEEVASIISADLPPLDSEPYIGDISQAGNESQITNIQNLLEDVPSILDFQNSSILDLLTKSQGIDNPPPEPVIEVPPPPTEDEKEIEAANIKLEEDEIPEEELQRMRVRAVSFVQGLVIDIPIELSPQASQMFSAAEELGESVASGDAVSEPEVEPEPEPEEEEIVQDDFKTIQDIEELPADRIIPRKSIRDVKFFLKFIKGQRKYYEQEEEEEIKELVERPKIDRAPLYEKHERLLREIEFAKLKNSFLQKKMAEYYKRKKMEHVLKENIEQHVDTQEKYHKKLDAFGHLLEIDESERLRMSEDLSMMKKERNDKLADVVNLFSTMQAREREIGFGLISSKTGNPIPDKTVERLLHRQSTQLVILVDLRLKFIKVRDKVLEKQTKYKALDNIGGNYHLLDFEELKAENRSYVDKIEERDEELKKLRNKYQASIQRLAHKKEKSAAFETDTNVLKDTLEELEMRALESRERVNTLKQKRDHMRGLANKLQAESGLLMQPILLRDMEDALEEHRLKSQEFEDLKAENTLKAEQIRAIRKNIEMSSDGLKRMRKKSDISMVRSRRKSDISMVRSRTCVRRPTLMEATLPGSQIKKKSFLNFMKHKL